MIKRDFKNIATICSMWILFDSIFKKNPKNENGKIHSINETIGNLNTDGTFDTIKTFFKKCNDCIVFIF